ncbi:MAG: hypothetical protein K2Q21_13170, partial [Chitinophagaceae bacterium]|nr:hypothetical protein [Chitinophagaceae bacterium]
ATNRELIIKVITGCLPIGEFPFEVITEKERKKIVAGLLHFKIRQYENTDETEKVLVYGKPFVDAPTLMDFLAATPDEEFEVLTQPLLDRLIKIFEVFGFVVRPLIDPITMLPYSSKVCRNISVPKGCYKPTGNECTVLHCDDIMRDGSKKADFRLPLGLEGMEYHQISACIQLEDGGYRPDDLIIHELRYSSELENNFYGEGGWRYPGERVKAYRNHLHTPVLRLCYFFSTLNFHDVKGGHPLAQRLNFSVFFIYVPASNTLYYYN